jgi:5-methylcytosine-specific restriction endonuclease McrA
MGYTKYCSIKCYNKYRREESEAMGMAKIRNLGEYKKWRASVFERDGHTCQICYKVDCYLEAHHIIEMSKDISLALKLKNGVTLCLGCHENIHGWKMKRRLDIQKLLQGE